MATLIDAVLSMHWADYRNDCKKAKVHLGFDINQSIPSKIFFTEGKADERPFVTQILLPGQTGILDRYYQCHNDFDHWQTKGKYFACRISITKKRSALKGLESCVSKYKTKPAISKMIYQLPPVSRQVYIISKNKNGAHSQLLNRTTLIKF